jgi:hypothetical protein
MTRLFYPIVVDADAKAFRVPPRTREELLWLRDYCNEIAREYLSEKEYAEAMDKARDGLDT